MSKKGYEKNKEFYEKYIQDSRTEDEKMMDIIHENSRKGRNDKIYQKSNKLKIKSIKTRNNTILITQLITILLLVMILVKLWI